MVMKDVVDRATGEMRGHYAFVWTGGMEQAVLAKEALHNVKINGRKLQVKFAREGAFKITSMTVTTDAQGKSARRVATLRSDLEEEEAAAAAAVAAMGSAHEQHPEAVLYSPALPPHDPPHGSPHGRGPGANLSAGPSPAWQNQEWAGAGYWDSGPQWA